MSEKIENVLVLQGGGSLGAFGCGVFKALTQNNIKIDIISGTSIGGINAAIISGSKDQCPEKALEEFWLELGESSVNLSPPILDWLSGYFSRFLPDTIPVDNTQLKSTLAFYSSAIYGNSKMFIPRWIPQYASRDPLYFRPDKWTYLYDHSPLLKTLDKYIDYNKLKPGGKANSRLIITAVDVLTAEPLIFDSESRQITPLHLLGTAGYPLDNFPWVEVEKGIYAWDGSLLSNTPLREVIEAAPRLDKRVFIVENYPKKIVALPENLPAVYHRARDIMFSDKTLHNVKMSKVITSYLNFIDELYHIIDKDIDHSKIDSKKLEKIREKYKRVKVRRGAEIKSISYIIREEPFPYLFENTDFSAETVKASIQSGEQKTNEILRNLKI